jgi:hypothetical protein
VPSHQSPSLGNQLEICRRGALIDFLRGLCLVIMTVDHLPLTLLKKFTWQTFGFFSAAEGFVLLSGLVAGQVYGRVVITQGVAALRRRALRRALTLYLTNAGLMTGVILAAAGGWVTLGGGASPSLSLWLKTMLGIGAPIYSEILRMYVIFLLVLPSVLWTLVNNRFLYVAAISGGLWLAAALGYGMSALPQSGYFDILSWQLLFVAGICLGFNRLRNHREFRMPAWWTHVSLAIVGTFFVIRHWYFFTGQPISPHFEWLWSWRRTLSVGRLLDFTAFSILVYRFRSPLTTLVRTMPGRAVVFLGQHSLQVFVWSIATTVLVCESEERWTSPIFLNHPLAYTVLIVASCFVPAWLHKHWQARRRREGGFSFSASGTIADDKVLLS